LVLPFKGSLLQPIVEAAGYLQPIAIRYREPDGKPSTVPAYDGDITFIYSFWRICGARALAVELIAGTPLPARGRHRRDLAREAESLIRAALASPAAGFPPDTRADPADGSP
jgi:1-acyl-sn-glycerol-3-phosphate acyltransferase